jgi:hypothetical protein
MDSSFVLTAEDDLASLGVTAQTLTAAQRRALDERGYLILPGPVGAKDLGRLRSAFDCACDAEGVPRNGTRHPARLIDCDAAFAGFLTHPAVLAAVVHVLGRPFVAGSVAGRDPLPGYGQQGLHVDCGKMESSVPFHVVTVLGLLDDFTPDNGATRLVPGSHHARRPIPKSFTAPTGRHPDQIVVTAPAGSVLVFNGHVWHGGTLNRSGGHRRVTHCAFLGREHPLFGAAGPPGLAPVTRLLRGADAARPGARHGGAVRDEPAVAG